MISAFQPDTWILQTHASGDNEQCLALAEALDCPVVIKRLDWAAAGAQDRAHTARLLSDTEDAARRRHALGLRAPWPSLIVCCGRRASRVAFWVKEQSGGRTRIVSIGRAHRAIDEYDLLVGTPQFMLPKRPNIVGLRLPLARQRQQPNAPTNVAAPKPWFTILLGGEVKEFDTAESTLKEVALRAQMAADCHGGSVIVCTSRRTPEAWAAAVEGALFRPRIYRWSPTPANDNHANDNANPYDTLLRESAGLFVTADSASMILDGCGSGTPTYVIESPKRIDVRRSWRRGLFVGLSKMRTALLDRGLPHVSERLDAAQDWLHARRILRYPRDLRRIQDAVYELGLAQPASSFDPEMLPRRMAAQDLKRMSGLYDVVTRCRALQGWGPRRAAE